VPIISTSRWAALVGPQLAEVTLAERQVRGGVVRVRVAPAWVKECQQMAPAIVSRMHAAGMWWVTKIEFIAAPVQAATAS
jgi:hypothetical protein